MKQSKQLLFYTLILCFFFALECVLTAVFSPLLAKSVFLSTVLPFVFRLFAMIPPFLALGLAFSSARIRSLPYALLFIGIYATASLFAQIPLSLLAFASSSASYGTILFSYMLTATLTALLFLFFFLLGYALFLQGGAKTDAKLFTLADSEARALALSSLLLTAYTLVREVIDMISYAKDKLYILTGEDIVSMIASLLFFTGLGFFSYLIGRASPRVLPTIPRVVSEEDDYI